MREVILFSTTAFVGYEFLHDESSFVYSLTFLYSRHTLTKNYLI